MWRWIHGWKHTEKSLKMDPLKPAQLEEAVVKYLFIIIHSLVR